MKTRFLLLIATLVLLLASCGQGIVVQEKEEVWVNFAVPEEKQLFSDADPRIDHFEYMAEALFEIATGHVLIGETKDYTTNEYYYKKVACVNGVSSPVGPFSQGRWVFTLKACNANGATLYTASEEVYLARNRSAYIIFDNPTRGTANGTVDVDVLVPKTAQSADMTITFWREGIQITQVNIRQSGSSTSGWAVAATSDGLYNRYTGSTSVSAGPYTAVFTLADAGEALAVDVYSGETTHITGTIWQHSYRSAEITVVTPEQAVCHMTASASEIQRNQSATFTLVKDKGSFDSSKVTWYLNGNQVQTGGMSYTFSPTASGLFEITACVYYEIQDTDSNSNTVRYNSSASAGCSLKVIDPLNNVTLTDRLQIIDVDWAYSLISLSRVAKSSSSMTLTLVPDGIKVTGVTSSARYLTFWAEQSTGSQYRLYSEDGFTGTGRGYRIVRWGEASSSPSSPLVSGGTVLNNSVSKTWTASARYVMVTIELDGDTTITDLGLYRVVPVYKASDNSTVSFPCNAAVPLIHSDGRYTLQELGFYQK